MVQHPQRNPAAPSGPPGSRNVRYDTPILTTLLAERKREREREKEIDRSLSVPSFSRRFNKNVPPRGDGSHVTSRRIVTRVVNVVARYWRYARLYMHLPSIRSAIYLGASGPGWRLRRFSVTGPSVNSAPVSHVPEPGLRSIAILWIVESGVSAGSSDRSDLRHLHMCAMRVTVSRYARACPRTAAARRICSRGSRRLRRSLTSLFYFRAHVNVVSVYDRACTMEYRSRHDRESSSRSSPLSDFNSRRGQAKGIFSHANACLSFSGLVIIPCALTSAFHRENRSGRAVNVETQRSLRWMERW